MVRILWFTLILTSFSVGFYNISDLTKDYYEYDVITKVVRVNEDNFTFPAVTICKNSSVKKHHFKNKTLIKEEIVTDLSMKNFIGDVYFQEKEKNLTDQLEFFKVPIPQELICTRFNGASNQNSDKVFFKVDDYNQLIVFIIDHIYIKNISENEYFLYELSKNTFRVFVEDNFLNSFNGKSLYMKENIKNFLSIVKLETEEKLDEPYNKCKKSTDNKPYRKANCLGKCMYGKVATKYNCTYDGLFKIDNLKECKNLSQSDTSQMQNEGQKDCPEKCPAECESVKFSSQVTETELKINNQTYFGFFVSDFSSLKITQIPKTTPFSFISADIGGALGLFMGISFLNFIEMFEFILDIFLISFSY
jgi:hypothetical protein